VSADEVLRDLKIKAHWIDPSSCTYYKLMVISKKSVQQAQLEKVMKSRIKEIKSQLTKGTDGHMKLGIAARRKHLQNAQALLIDTDFSAFPEELKKEVYVKRVRNALKAINKETSRLKGHMALFVLNEDGTLESGVIGQILKQFRYGDYAVDRLMADCSSKEDCIKHSKQRGFSMLAFLKASTQIATSPMGELKGTLTLSRLVYDIESRKVVKGPETVSAQVIGWSNDELDWNAAAQKTLAGLK